MDDGSRSGDPELEPDGDPTNSFALVTYVPGELGRLIDGIRAELEPGAPAPKAHVTILPPRPLALPFEAQVGAVLSHFDSLLAAVTVFEIELEAVEIFEVTSVVYLAVRAGFGKLCGLHDRLASGPLEFVEPYAYHPHLTLAQGLAPEQARQTAADAAERLKGIYRFQVEQLTFVQSTTTNQWRDLAAFSLPRAFPAPSAVRRQHSIRTA